MKSQEKFDYYLRQTRDLLRKTAESNDHERLADCSSKVHGAGRVFITASGSSIPGGEALELLLRERYPEKPTYLVSTSQLLDGQALKKSDLVILFSQGFNRSDAFLIADHVKHQCSFLLVTANQQTDGDRLVFYPNSMDERLFCRPCGVITCFYLACLLGSEPEAFSTILEECLFGIDTADVFDEKIRAVAPRISSAQEVIVLASSKDMIAASNVALALREGACKSSSVFEIEYYGHGQYVPHLADKNKTFYLVLHSDQTFVKASTRRITPLLDKTNAQFAEFVFPGSFVQSASAILRFGGLLVSALNHISGYDMNSPVGKEENRGFHEVSASFYGED